MTVKRHPNIVHPDEVEAIQRSKGTRFGFAARRLAPAAGAQAIGCTLYEVEPGRTAFPLHYHCANEEALYILEGEGTVRIGETRTPVGPGDFVGFPTGPDSAHQLFNTGSGPLRYLCLSTMQRTEVVGYPDSDKIGAMASAADAPAPYLRVIFPGSAGVDYYDGEETGE